MYRRKILFGLACAVLLSSSGGIQATFDVANPYRNPSGNWNAVTIAKDFVLLAAFAILGYKFKKLNVQPVVSVPQDLTDRVDQLERDRQKMIRAGFDHDEIVVPNANKDKPSSKKVVLKLDGNQNAQLNKDALHSRLNLIGTGLFTFNQHNELCANYKAMAVGLGLNKVKIFIFDQHDAITGIDEKILAETSGVNRLGVKCDTLTTLINSKASQQGVSEEGVGVIVGDRLVSFGQNLMSQLEGERLNADITKLQQGQNDAMDAAITKRLSEIMGNKYASLQSHAALANRVTRLESNNSPKSFTKQPSATVSPKNGTEKKKSKKKNKQTS